MSTTFSCYYPKSLSLSLYIYISESTLQDEDFEHCWKSVMTLLYDLRKIRKNCRAWLTTMNIQNAERKIKRNICPKQYIHGESLNDTRESLRKVGFHESFPMCILLHTFHFNFYRFPTQFILLSKLVCDIVVRGA